MRTETACANELAEFNALLYSSERLLTREAGLRRLDQLVSEFNLGVRQRQQEGFS